MRTKYEIHESILQLITIQSGITNIVYKCNLNFKIARKYINVLKDMGCLVIINTDDRVFYKITDKGKTYLDKLNVFFQ